MLKQRRKTVIKEAVKSDTGSKAHWIKKMGKVCFSRKCHIVIGGKGMVLDEKRSVDNEGNSKHLRKTPTCNGLTKLLKVY
ncbi:hypothetical protein AXF23_02845 [Prevotella sp. oral taxon 313]|uniref:hypothetical protein n=1 Tax=Prevotella sp. oral taxon 313 TaxID=652722 RepID=UPI000D1E4E9B|nr:hypothetical protein [Prevotella sp. oral taxon 313]PTL30132.1 hypothetical protein AXF23_02845 [Prevotella sp. oral taxon 313]